MDEPPDPAARSSPPVSALLAAYAEALSVARSLPLFVRHWFRPFVRPILVIHVSRRVAALKRSASAQAAVAEAPDSWSQDIQRLELFERSLPPARTRTWVVGLLTVTFVV